MILLKKSLCLMILKQSHEVGYAIHTNHMPSGCLTDWSVNYWKWLPTGISGLRHRMTLKLSAIKFLDKRWLVMMSSVGSRDKSPFYKPENRIRIFNVTGKTGFLNFKVFCQMIPTKRYNISYTINAVQVTLQAGLKITENHAKQRLLHDFVFSYVTAVHL